MKWRGHAAERCRGCGRRLPASPACPLCPPVVVPEPVILTPEPPVVQRDTLMVPDGPVVEVLSWVAGDPARAQVAFEVESGRSSPRVTLLAELAHLGAEPAVQEPGDGGEA